MSVQEDVLAGKYENRRAYGPTRSMREAYRDEDHDIRVRFHADLAREYELTGHPKEGRLFDLAWDDRHSEGLYAVAQRYDELAELLR